MELVGRKIRRKSGSESGILEIVETGMHIDNQ